MRQSNKRSLSKFGMFALLATLMQFLLATPAAAQDAPRVWTHKSGAKQKCILVSQDEDYCYLRRVDNGKQIKMPKRHLAQEDQTFLKTTELADEDDEQWGHVKELIPLIYTDPIKAEASLIEYHNAYDESPYAGLLSAVATCMATNKHKKAHAILTSTITRIKDQREYRPGAHATTLASCLNNQAICKLKLKKSDSAAALFVQAATEANLPVIGFNGQMLANVASGQGGLELTRRNHQKLLVGIPRSPYNNALADGYYYSLRVEEPMASQSSLASLRTVAVKPDFTGRSLAASGSGFVIAPEWVATSRDVVIHDEIQTPTIGVMDSPATKPVKLAADRVLVSANKKYDVAFLHVPKLTAPPIPLQQTAIPDGIEMRLFGYSTKSQLKLVDHAGKVKRGTRSGVFETAIVHEEGLGGSPAINGSGELVGMALASTGSRPLEFIDATLLASLGGTMNPPLSIQTPQTSASSGAVDWKKIQASLTPSLLPVIVYADPADINRMGPKGPGGAVAGKPANYNLQTEKIARDHWCISCDGKGIVDCPIKGCNKGTVTVRKPTVVGRNVDGSEIIANKPFPERCSRCSGRGAFQCRQCNNGRI